MKNQNNKAIFILMGIIIAAALVIFILDNNRTAEISINDFTSCADAGYPIMESYPRQCQTSNGRNFVEEIIEDNDHLTYFTEQMWSQGVENLGGAMPVEGFTPDLYIGAFPDLQESDFDGAAAYGGTWTFENNNLVFQKDNSQPITSAEGTVTQAGMLTLLNNLADRLNIEPNSEENVDLIIEKIEREEFNSLEYFREQMRSQGIENLGGAVPVEGFTPDLYLGAFPGLEESDFDNAEARGGTWFYNNNRLVFERAGEYPSTSSEESLSDSGMQTLLNHLADRLNIEPNSQENIDLIIAEIE